jgi:hypothetical protein
MHMELYRYSCASGGCGPAFGSMVRSAAFGCWDLRPETSAQQPLAGSMRPHGCGQCWYRHHGHQHRRLHLSMIRSWWDTKSPRMERPVERGSRWRE